MRTRSMPGICSSSFDLGDFRRRLYHVLSSPRDPAEAYLVFYRTSFSTINIFGVHPLPTALMIWEAALVFTEYCWAVS